MPSKLFRVRVRRETTAEAELLLRAPHKAAVLDVVDKAAATGAFVVQKSVVVPLEITEQSEETLQLPPTLLDAYRAFVKAKVADSDYLLATLPDYKSWSLASQVSLLLEFAERYGMEPDWLDGLIHDAKSAEASEINNSGLRGQIEYLVDSNGYEGTRRLLLDILACPKEEEE